MSFPPDTRRRHAPVAALLFALALGGLAIGTTEFAAMSLIPFFASDLRVSEAVAGRAISAYALGVVVGAPLITIAAARADRRHLLVGLMLAFAAGNLLCALAPSFPAMLLFRFVSGLPHGAYFGVAALMAASLVPPDRRATAVSRVMLGLTIATVAGVPAANAIGQWLGWRWGFAINAALALLTAVLVGALARPTPAPPGAAPATELRGLRNGALWLTLAIGAVGFGGMFAVYTYLASTLLWVTHTGPAAIPLVLAVFGFGMVVGTFIAGWAADRRPMATAGALLLAAAVLLALYPLAVHDVRTLSVLVFLIGCTGSLGIPLQLRLMDVAGDAQTVAAALHHSAFNLANALGPWAAGLAIGAGAGFAASGPVGAGLATGGLLLWVVALRADRRRRRSARLRPRASS
jgi:DHA1 family inner membrane transport protein